MGLKYKGISQYCSNTWHIVEDDETGRRYEVMLNRGYYGNDYIIDYRVGDVWLYEKNPQRKKEIIACAWPMVNMD